MDILSKEQEKVALTLIINLYPDLIDSFFSKKDYLIQFLYKMMNPSGELKSKSDIISIFIQECGSTNGIPFHGITPWHGEPYPVHLIVAAILARQWAEIWILSRGKEIELPVSDILDACMIAGLLHDIGKPFACGKIRNICIFTGHAQISTALLDKILKDYPFKEEILWAINQHMCKCTHMNDLSKQFKLIVTDLIYSLPYECNPLIAFLILAALSYGDYLARDSKDVSADKLLIVSEHSFELVRLLENAYTQYKTDPKSFNLSSKRSLIIVELFGVSGSGKTHSVEELRKSGIKQRLIHLSRDNALFTVHAKFIGMTDGLTYKQIYEAVYGKGLGSKEVDAEWILMLNDALEKAIDDESLIIVIDTVQLLYHHAWTQIISGLSEEARSIYCSALRLGLYLIPFNQIAPIISAKVPESKTGKTCTLPSYDLSWPSVNSEKGDLTKPTSINFGTGSINQLTAYIKNYGEISDKVVLPEIQKSMVFLSNSLIKENDYEGACNDVVRKYYEETDGGILQWAIEYTSIDGVYIIFKYPDGQQRFNGPTRDIRGSGVFYCFKHKKFFNIRPTFPVFPEMKQIADDHHVCPYLRELFELLGYDKSKPKIKSLFECKDVFRPFLRLCMTPKADGSLLNCTVITKENPTYEFVINMISKCDLPQKSYYVVPERMIIILGSKGTIFSKDPVNKRFHEAIHATYNTIDAFVSIVVSSIEKGTINGTFDPTLSITFHFEAISKIPTPELTVVYGEAMARFLGTTIGGIDDDLAKFLIPEGADTFDFKCMTPVKEFTNFNDLLDVFNDTEQKLLDGHPGEPEGWVIWIKTEESWYGIKLKYDFYYVAHKPDSKHNQAKALEMMSNPKYKEINKRLSKFAEKLSISDILQDRIVQSELKELCALIISFTKANELPDTAITKKDWATDCKEIIPPLIEMFKVIFEEVSKHYTKFKEIPATKQIFAFLMRIYDILKMKDNKHKILEINEEITQIIEECFFS
jgi:hypothetical protein